jgi:hypothetical protein
MTSLIYGIILVGCGCLLYFGAQASGGIAYLVFGITAMLLGLILPGRFRDTGNADLAIVTLFLSILFVDADPAWVFGSSALICLAFVVWTIWTRRQMQHRLTQMWQLADQYGYGVFQIQQLAITTNKLADYPETDWLLTRADHPYFYPNSKAVRGVMDAMQVGRMA